MATSYEIREGLGGRWNVFKDGEQEPYFGDNKDEAVGHAINNAKREIGPVIVEVVYSDGSRIKEWPPGDG